jgi:hypothetical protein
MGQIFYSRFFKTLDQMGSDGQPFWLKWNIGSCGKRWSSTSFSIVRSLLCKHAATERNCEHRHGVWQSSRPAVHDVFFAANSAVSATFFLLVHDEPIWRATIQRFSSELCLPMFITIHNICVALINSVAKTFMNRYESCVYIDFYEIAGHYEQPDLVLAPHPVGNCLPGTVQQWWVHGKPGRRVALQLSFKSHNIISSLWWPICCSKHTLA